MVNSMENYNNISCDTGQGKTISVLTLDKINMMGIRMENYNYITSDTEDKTDWHSIWWIQFQF